MATSRENRATRTRCRPGPIAGPMHRLAPAVVIAVVRHIQPFVGREGQTERIAKSPRDQLRRAAADRHLQNRAVAGNTAGDHLSRLSDGAKRNKGAGHGFVVGQRSKGIHRSEVDAAQRYVTTGNIVRVGMAL